MLEPQTATETNNQHVAPETVPLRLHPRVFAALGKDLVTNDVVAVLELVKNAYDAFAENVWVEFGTDEDNGVCLEIRDDGLGMSRDVIENVWCLVATPHRERNPFVKRETNSDAWLVQKVSGVFPSHVWATVLTCSRSPAKDPAGKFKSIGRN